MKKRLLYALACSALLVGSFLAIGPTQETHYYNRPLSMQPAPAATPTSASFPTLTGYVIADGGGFANVVIKAPNQTQTVLPIPDPVASYAPYVGWPVTVTITFP